MQRTRRGLTNSSKPPLRPRRSQLNRSIACDGRQLPGGRSGDSTNRFGRAAVPSEGSLRRVLICIPAVGLASGLGLRLAGLESWVDWVWTLSTVPVLLALLAQIIRS